MTITASLQRGTHATVLDCTEGEDGIEPFAVVCVHDNHGNESRVHVPTLADAERIAAEYNAAFRRPLPVFAWSGDGSPSMIWDESGCVTAELV